MLSCCLVGCQSRYVDHILVSQDQQIAYKGNSGEIYLFCFKRFDTNEFYPVKLEPIKGKEGSYYIKPSDLGKNPCQLNNYEKIYLGSNSSKYPQMDFDKRDGTNRIFSTDYEVFYFNYKEYESSEVKTMKLFPTDLTDSFGDKVILYSSNTGEFIGFITVVVPVGMVGMGIAIPILFFGVFLSDEL